MCRQGCSMINPRCKECLTGKTNMLYRMKGGCYGSESRSSHSFVPQSRDSQYVSSGVDYYARYEKIFE